MQTPAGANLQETFPCDMRIISNTRFGVACKSYKYLERISMAKMNLSRLDFDELMGLRDQVEQALVSHRGTLEKQLERLGGSFASLGGKVVRVGRGSILKGKKVAPKYRGPGGETWAGRGAKPRWLTAAIKDGKKLEQFLIDKVAGSGKKKRKAKG
jgi:DNA-binding protein H-NS